VHKKHNMKAKVLIVDDEPGVRKLLAAVLEGSYDVTEAESGAACKNSSPPTRSRM